MSNSVNAMEEDEFANIRDLAVTLHNKVKMRQEQMNRKIAEYTKYEKELRTRKANIESKIIATRDNLAMMVKLVEEKRNELSRRKQRLSGEEKPDGSKVVPIDLYVTCQAKQNERNSLSERQEKRPRLFGPVDYYCDDKDQIEEKLMQLQRATYMDVKAVGEHEKVTALSTLSSYQPRPINWVLALHREAAREALQLACRTTGDTANISWHRNVRIEDETKKCVRFSNRVETSDGGWGRLKTDNQGVSGRGIPLSTLLKRAIEE